MVNFIRKYNLKPKKRSGWTMMEVMITLIVIIALSAGIFFAYSNVQKSRKIATMKSDMSSIATACVAYELLNSKGTAPADMNELMTGLPASDSLDGLDKTFLQNTRSNSNAASTMLDPWGNAYIVDGSSRTITSVADNHNEHPETVLRF